MFNSDLLKFVWSVDRSQKIPESSHEYGLEFQYVTIVKIECRRIKNIISSDGAHCAQKLVHQVQDLGPSPHISNCLH